MTQPVGEEQLLDLERLYWTAIKDKDSVVARQLTNDPCLITGPQGVSELDHEALTQMLDRAPWSLEDFELADLQVRLVRDDVAIVAYKVRESLQVDGQRLTLDAADSSTWIRTKGRWLCASHSEAIVGDPFGRDRAA